MRSLRPLFLGAALGGSALAASTPKRGLSGLSGCGDAKALGLQHSWSYNWGMWPTSIDAAGNGLPAGTMACAPEPPQTAEHVPMFWGCWGNCTSGLWPTVREDWKKVGVKYILGFNEPDNLGQSNLTPEQAAVYWYQLDDFANTFDPPLTLVGPGMTHWGDDGSSDWLDQFFGNLTDTHIANMKYLAQHDYSGSASGIIAKANALYKKYGKKVWLTEFSVGYDKDRATNDAFMKEILPQLDAAESVFRYAWYSTRNAPTSWVNESYLLPPRDATGGWGRNSGHSCKGDEMLWLSQHGDLETCQVKTLGEAKCSEPKTAIYQSGDPKNCYCAQNSTCTLTASSWQDVYEHHGTDPTWAKTGNMACGASEMAWLSQHGSLIGCQYLAKGSPLCASAPTGPQGTFGTKVVMYQDGDVNNCYCQSRNATTCTKEASSWLDLYVQPEMKPLSLTPSSTGKLYTVK